MSRVGERTAVAAGLALLLLLGACGVPQDATDRHLSRDRVAFEPPPDPTTTTTTPTTSTRPPPSSTTTTTVVGPTTTAVPTTTLAPPASYPFMLFWLRDEQVVRVRRSLPVEATLDLVVDAFRLGPDEIEAENNLRTALPPPSAIAVTVEAGTATVDLDPTFLTLPGSEQVRGICQIVFTVTGVGGIGLVRFSINGRRVAVPRSDGQPTTRPVSRDDYASLVLDGGEALVVPTTTLPPSIPPLNPNITIGP